jgi:iron complex outermembrane receptor protein
MSRHIYTNTFAPQIKQAIMKQMYNTLVLLFTVLTCIVGSTSKAVASTDIDKLGAIKGSVVTNDNKPAVDVTVVIKGTTQGTVTNEYGRFEFSKLKTGNYTLEISLVGYETIAQSVLVEDGKTASLQLQLQLSNKQLEEVIVTTGVNKFAKKQNTTAARLPLKNLENPQSYSVVTKALLQEQVVTNFDDALKNAPGIDKLWSATGRGGDGAAYFSLRGFAVQPSMINGIAGQTNGGLDPANIEQIEVIKGPAGTLFGSSLVSFGGLINIVTKKPFEGTAGEIAYTNGTFGLNRLTADYNTVLGKDKNLLLRVNGAYHYENSFQDAGFKKSVFLAPSLVYNASDRLSFHVNAEFYNSEATNPLSIFLNRSRALIYTTPEQLGIDYKKSFTSNDVTIKNPTTNVFAQMNYKLSSKWLSQTNLSQSVRKSDGLYSYIMFLQATNDTLLSRLVSDQNAIGTTTNFQQNFIGDFTIGKMRNRTVIGFDVTNLKTTNNSTAYIQFDFVNSTKYDSRYAQLTQQAVDAKIAANTSPTKNQSDTYVYSAYFSNVTNITEQLLLMTSLRVDKFDNKGTTTFSTGATAGAYQQTALSPKFGLVYAVLKDKVSLFGNYMNGFRNVAPTTQPDGSVSNFTPQQANQWEGGVKMSLANGKVNLNISYYDILVKDVVIADPDRVGYTIQQGNISSKGFETELIANPITGLNIVAGYSFNDSKNVKAATATNGLRPNNAGPQNLANLWVSYTVAKGKLKGAGIGFGGNYASENLITNSMPTGAFTIPAYTIVNATLFYQLAHVRLSCKLDNIANQQYWKGWSTIEPQMPRRFVTSVSFKF